MAESKKSFPMLPISHWWNLRRKFRQSLPGVVTGKYLATVLNMAEKSANANVLPFLKVLGIIDDEGKTTERAKLWRDDQHYPKVCGDILNEVYPKGLLEAVPNPNEDRDAAERWFAHHSGAGEAAAGRMAALYSVLVDADVSKQNQEKPAKTAKPTQPKAKEVMQPAVNRAGNPAANPGSSNPPAAPGVHINLEIHISADASADQIDLIFAAMAKHIYKRV